MYTIAETLDALAEHLPEELVSPAAYARVRRAASRLPAPLSSRIYLECRLADGASRVDLILGVEREGAELLAAERHPAVLPTALGQSPAWRRVAALCRQWLAPGSQLAGGLARVWLEMDLDATESPSSDLLRAPGVFVNFAGDPKGPLSTTERAAVAYEALSVLAGGTATSLSAPLARCFESLPTGAAVAYLGVFSARGTGTLRLCVDGFGAETVADYLAAIGHTALAVASIRRTVRSLQRASGARPGLLHVDIGSDRIVAGIEYSLSRPQQLRGEVLETTFLDELVRRGLCTPGKRSGLATWPGTSVELLRHTLWPSGVWRRVNHVKLVFTGRKPVEAKAYLFFRHAYDSRLARSDLFRRAR